MYLLSKPEQTKIAYVRPACKKRQKKKKLKTTDPLSSFSKIYEKLIQ